MINYFQLLILDDDDDKVLYDDFLDGTVLNMQGTRTQQQC